MAPRKTASFYLQIIVIILCVLAIGGYAIFRSQAIRQGPQISIEKPLNGSLINTSEIEISGTAKNIAFISLNDRQIFTDTTGRFSEKLLIPYGYTILTLQARDKFGKTVVKRVEVVYK